MDNVPVSLGYRPERAANTGCDVITRVITRKVGTARPATYGTVRDLLASW